MFWGLFYPSCFHQFQDRSTNSHIHGKNSVRAFGQPVICHDVSRGQKRIKERRSDQSANLAKSSPSTSAGLCHLSGYSRTSSAFLLEKRIALIKAILLQGFYRFENFTMDWGVLPIREFFYGRYRGDFMVVRPNRDDVFCSRATLDIVPR